MSGSDIRFGRRGGHNAADGAGELLAQIQAIRDAAGTTWPGTDDDDDAGEQLDLFG